MTNESTEEIKAEAAGDIEYLRYALSHALRELREHRGLTQAQLAARLGVEQAAVSKLESPRRTHDLVRIAEVIRALEGELIVAVAADGLVEPVWRGHAEWRITPAPVHLHAVLGDNVVRFPVPATYVTNFVSSPGPKTVA